MYWLVRFIAKYPRDLSFKNMSKVFQIAHVHTTAAITFPSLPKVSPKKSPFASTHQTVTVANKGLV